MSLAQVIVELPAEVRALLAGAHHVDVKGGEGQLTLREFVSAALSWQPTWMKALFRFREPFARLLRLDEPKVPMGTRLRPEDVSFVPGARASFFTVAAGSLDRYVVLEATDKHLTAYCVIVAEPVNPARTRFHFITVVRFHRWTGRLYFRLIRPFHHLIVASMVRAGIAGPSYGDRGLRRLV